MKLENRILFGRLLTRSGDQAWDFATPIVLLQILPGQIRLAALYYLLVRVATVIFLPPLARIIDRKDRLASSQIGIFLQLVGVIAGFFAVIAISRVNVDLRISSSFAAAFILLTIGGILSQLGASFMDISIANDLIPSTFLGHELSAFNSKLRQIDLFTEVASPVLAGLMMIITLSNWPLFGFSLVALWNLISFFPEYALLKSVFTERPDLKEKVFRVGDAVKQTIFVRLSRGWGSFFREPVALVMVAYAVLWLSVLSPHGVLLTAFLKDGWEFSELSIGFFRAVGAVVGLAATILFPIVVRKRSVESASFVFLIFQAVTLVIGLGFFWRVDGIGQIGFLVLVLASRIGIYGFSLGEMQIRQERIAPNVRGEVNGFANSLTAIATIGLFTAGVVLPSTEDFKYLVFGSVIFVCLSLVIYGYWLKKYI